MIKWGQKTQHQKIPRASNKTPQKYLDQNPTPKTLLFVSHWHCYPKKIFAKIFLPKKILKSKISHPKDSFNNPFHLKPHPSPPLPQCMVITQVTPRAPLPVVLGKLEDPSINCKSHILVRLASWKLITANSLFYRHLYKRDTSLKQKPDLVLAFLLTTPFSLLSKKQISRVDGPTLSLLLSVDCLSLLLSVDSL